MSNLNFTQAIQTLETMRQSIERTYREAQETGRTGEANIALQRFTVRVRSIRATQPEAFKEWTKGNARFLRAVEEGRNPILC